jgi:hypothetical protein
MPALSRDSRSPYTGTGASGKETPKVDCAAGRNYCPPRRLSLKETTLMCELWCGPLCGLLVAFGAMAWHASDTWTRKPLGGQ